MGKKGQKDSRKDKKRSKPILSEIIPMKILEQLQQLKKSIIKQEKDKNKMHNYTKQGIKRLDNAKKRKIVRKPR